jgi:hypothetical protein
VVIEKGSCILGNSDKFEPFRRLNINAETELSQVIDIVDAPIAKSVLALQAIAELSAELNPWRK